MTSTKVKVTGRRQRVPIFGCSEANQGLVSGSRAGSLPAKRAAKSNEKRAAKLKQQEIFIPQWPELAII